MNELTYTSGGPDNVFLANTNLFLSALFTLQTFRNRWADDKLGSQSVLQTAYDWYKETFEGGRTGNRQHIAARKLARQDLDLRIQKTLQYLSVMADESDITILLNTGVVKTRSRRKSRKPAAKPVVAPS